MSSALPSLQHPLPYNPEQLPRERQRHYIAASQAEVEAMLQTVGAKTLADLYAHIPTECRFDGPPALPDELEYGALLQRLESLAERNRHALSFIGDGLPDFAVHPIVGHVCGIRNLTTAYTPYQPERSQGSLMTHWIYQCALSQLTGFEAINSSLYDRATATYEAICTAVRLSKAADTALVPEAIYPGDLEVLRTLAADTELTIETLPLDPTTGRIDAVALRTRAQALGPKLAAVVFPQVNTLGLLEDVDTLTDLCAELGCRSIAAVDPLHLATGGLKRPVDFGRKGADMIVGEAQHLAIGPNFGGPGLGLFGVRCNKEVPNDIRQTPGRYVGKAKDLAGRDCLVMVLSTREQHIRKDKATSNICSNQAFLATLAGAALLGRGERGLTASLATAEARTREAASALTRIPGVTLAYPTAAFLNELVLKLPVGAPELIEAARRDGIHLGVRVTDRVPGATRLLKLSFSDRHTAADIERLAGFLARHLKATPQGAGAPLPTIPAAARRAAPVGLPDLDLGELKSYYNQLGELNVSPDNACYPLGSCTMKYNPYVNDWAASLPGFTEAHPQAPVEDVQGCLEVLFEIQEWFKRITGLAGVTTQPLAGAQGELVGLKLFQAYHRSRGEAHRDVILIPASSHGTNFATAAMAGFVSRKVGSRTAGLVVLKAAPDGTVDQTDFAAKLAEHGPHLAGIMVTNPNTSGLFERDFKKMADAVHTAGGLVYMDGANMNAIAGWIDLGKMGVDAVHNNLHKTWTIPHGGGGPGDAMVAVSERLLPFLPGHQIERRDGHYLPVKAPQSIGSFHRHWGNFAHKIRAYAYLLRLGRVGVPRMTALAVLSARYCYEKLRTVYPTLPAGSEQEPRMHEFILTLAEADFERLEKAGVPRALVIARTGKLFLDFGFHAPTVAWPEVFGLMIEPTESYTKAELDRFIEAVSAIRRMLREHPTVLTKVPLFTPVDRIDDVSANRNLVLSEPLRGLPATHPNRLDPAAIHALPVAAVYEKILAAAGA